MVKRLIGSSVVLLLTSSCAQATCGSVLMSNDFDRYGGDFRRWTKSDATEDWPLGSDVETSMGSKPSGLVFMKHTIDENGEVGDGMLKVLNPQGCSATEQCGVTFDVRLPEPVREATLSYSVMFEEGYDFHIGGKLPGLCSEDCPAGCSNVGKSDGFSARAMWRRDAALVSYSYFQDMDTSKTCGEDWAWGDAHMEAGVWNKVEMYVKVNTGGAKNGIQRIKFNGKTVLDDSNICYVAEEQRMIEKFTFRTFHGGSGKKWESPKDQHIYFDDLLLREGNCLGGSSSPPTENDEGGGGDGESTGEENLRLLHRLLRFLRSLLG